jgi:hypothetical protein
MVVNNDDNILHHFYLHIEKPIYFLVHGDQNNRIDPFRTELMLPQEAHRLVRLLRALARASNQNLGLRSADSELDQHGGPL